MKTIKKITVLLFITLIAFSCTKNENPTDGDCNTVCSYTLIAGETAGTAASSIEGTYNLTMHFSDAASPYPDGTKATFILRNNVLTVQIEGKDCITIKNPRLTTPGSTEIQFRDTCRDKISYDVSMTSSGELNEINISSTETDKWLGQFNNR